MLVDDIGSLDHGVARGDGAVGLDLEDKAVVVGVLTDTASLNELGATGNRRVQRVEERDVTPDDVSRIAAQNAKGVIASIVREAGRQSIYEEFSDRVGDLVTGTVLQARRTSPSSRFATAWRPSCPITT